MGTSGWIATCLDYQMLETAGDVRIFSPSTADADLPRRTGRDVARELGGRLLLRYMLPTQVGSFTEGSVDLHWVTPTPYSPEEALRYLFLKAQSLPRTHVLFLNSAEIPAVQGPRWIEFGHGIEYLLPEGFPKRSIASAYELDVR